MDRRKLVYYLLLNAFVSACVTGTILFWYDRNYRALSQSSVQQAGPSSGNSAPTNASLQTDIPVSISSVVGAGTADSEIVVVKYEGDAQLDLTSWQLKDENGNTFTFPKLTLYPNGAVQVHTVAGTDTVIDLYWGIGESVWSSGENARLFDSQGNLRAVYRVP
jgi:hypothetical protein